MGRLMDSELDQTLGSPEQLGCLLCEGVIDDFARFPRVGSRFFALAAFGRRAEASRTASRASFFRCQPPHKHSLVHQPPGGTEGDDDDGHNERETHDGDGNKIRQPRRCRWPGDAVKRQLMKPRSRIESSPAVAEASVGRPAIEPRSRQIVGIHRFSRR